MGNHGEFPTYCDRRAIDSRDLPSMATNLCYIFPETRSMAMAVIGERIRIDFTYDTQSRLCLSMGRSLKRIVQRNRLWEDLCLNWFLVCPGSVRNALALISHLMRFNLRVLYRVALALNRKLRFPLVPFTLGGIC